MLNLFRVDGVCTITDLPGYGFAKVSEEMQEEWRASIGAYMREREALRLAVLFVDAQRRPQESDSQLLDYLESSGVPAVVAATKVDRLKPAPLEEALGLLRERLVLPSGQPVLFSSKTGEGQRELWTHMERACTRTMHAQQSRRGA
jgi:GTP-binding protein